MAAGTVGSGAGSGPIVLEKYSDILERQEAEKLIQEWTSNKEADFFDCVEKMSIKDIGTLLWRMKYANKVGKFDYEPTWGDFNDLREIFEKQKKFLDNNKEDLVKILQEGITGKLTKKLGQQLIKKQVAERIIRFDERMVAWGEQKKAILTVASVWSPQECREFMEFLQSCKDGRIKDEDTKKYDLSNNNSHFYFLKQFSADLNYFRGSKTKRDDKVNTTEQKIFNSLINDIKAIEGGSRDKEIKNSVDDFKKSLASWKNGNRGEVLSAIKKWSEDELNDFLIFLQSDKGFGSVESRAYLKDAVFLPLVEMTNYFNYFNDPQINRADKRDQVQKIFNDLAKEIKKRKLKNKSIAPAAPVTAAPTPVAPISTAPVAPIASIDDFEKREEDAVGALKKVLRDSDNKYKSKDERVLSVELASHRGRMTMALSLAKDTIELAQGRTENDRQYAIAFITGCRNETLEYINEVVDKKNKGEDVDLESMKRRIVEVEEKVKNILGNLLADQNIAFDWARSSTFNKSNEKIEEDERKKNNQSKTRKIAEGVVKGVYKGALTVIGATGFVNAYKYFKTQKGFEDALKSFEKGDGLKDEQSAGLVEYEKETGSGKYLDDNGNEIGKTKKGILPQGAQYYQGLSKTQKKLHLYSKEKAGEYYKKLAAIEKVFDTVESMDITDEEKNFMLEKVNNIIEGVTFARNEDGTLKKTAGAEITALENVKFQEVLNEYVTKKVTGMQVARDFSNTAILASTVALSAGSSLGLSPAAAAIAKAISGKAVYARLTSLLGFNTALRTKKLLDEKDAVRIANEKSALIDGTKIASPKMPEGFKEKSDFFFNEVVSGSFAKWGADISWKDDGRSTLRKAADFTKAVGIATGYAGVITMGVFNETLFNFLVNIRSGSTAFNHDEMVKLADEANKIVAAKAVPIEPTVTSTPISEPFKDVIDASAGTGKNPITNPDHIIDPVVMGGKVRTITKAVDNFLHQEGISNIEKDAFIRDNVPHPGEITDDNREHLLRDAINRFSIRKDIPNLIDVGSTVSVKNGLIEVGQGGGTFVPRSVSDEYLRVHAHRVVPETNIGSGSVEQDPWVGKQWKTDILRVEGDNDMQINRVHLPYNNEIDADYIDHNGDGVPEKIVYRDSHNNVISSSIRTTENPTEFRQNAETKLEELIVDKEAFIQEKGLNPNFVRLSGLNIYRPGIENFSEKIEFLKHAQQWPGHIDANAQQVKNIFELADGYKSSPDKVYEIWQSYGANRSYAEAAVGVATSYNGESILTHRISEPSVVRGIMDAVDNGFSGNSRRLTGYLQMFVEPKSEKTGAQNFLGIDQNEILKIDAGRGNKIIKIIFKNDPDSTLILDGANNKLGIMNKKMSVNDWGTKWTFFGGTNATEQLKPENVEQALSILDPGKKLKRI